MNNKFKIIFFGTPDFALPSLQCLLDDPSFDVVSVVTQPDKPVGKKQVVTPSPVKLLATAKGVPVLQPEKLKNNEIFLQQLHDLKADLNVVVAYGKILPQSILDAATYGSINVHGSKLPKYRGASPITQAIINGDESICVTVQKMVFAMDAGPVIAYGPEIQVLPTDTTGSLGERLSNTVYEVLPDAIKTLLGGDIVLAPQDESRASYVKLIAKEDGRIDWREDPEAIERKIRAYQPWPVAHTRISDMSVKIFAAEVADIANAAGNILITNNELYIGRLKITELQVAGKNKISGRDFAVGYAKLNGTSVL